MVLKRVTERVCAGTQSRISGVRLRVECFALHELSVFMDEALKTVSCGHILVYTVSMSFVFVAVIWRNFWLRKVPVNWILLVVVIQSLCAVNWQLCNWEHSFGDQTCSPQR